MSGICGIFRFDGTPVSERDLDRQIKRLAHRGPDRARAWTAGSIGLGHLMMRITREDAYDAQPLHGAGLSLVADLRLDNREELAAALSIGTTALADMPDSALLLAAYKKWDSDCVDHLVGDFAFAIWDGRKQSLTLGRDHIGQRHVFYHKADGFFAFATEIKGLWALPQVPRLLIEARIPQALLFDEPTDVGATDYVGIRALPGGSVLTVNADGATAIRRYWEPHADPAHVGRDEAYYIETYRKVLTEAVACRLRRASTMAGLFMGGGFELQRHLRTGGAGRDRASAKVHRRVVGHAGRLSRPHHACAALVRHVPPPHAPSRYALYHPRRPRYLHLNGTVVSLG